MFVSEQLDRSHDTSTFDSGEPELDEWLRHTASHAAAKQLSRVFVWTDDGNGQVVAFYSLSAHIITSEELPRRFRGEPQQIPAVLLGKLALDRSLHGQGLGAALLAEAFERVLAAAKEVAVRYVVVDALHDQAANFYEKHGFRRCPGSNRLVLKLSSIQASAESS